MTLLFLSFIAGILTVTAPCILIFLPVILGGSIVGKRDWRRPLIITGSLVVSVIVFTLLLKASTALLGVDQKVWQILSGCIVILLGLHYIGIPIWEKFVQKIQLSLVANRELAAASRQQGTFGTVMTGAALGPVFASCSPTFAFIVAAVIPADFVLGIIYLTAYVIGMGATLLLIAFAGQAALAKLRVINNPRGWLPKAVGIMFVVVGLTIVTGLDKTIQTHVLQQGWYDPITQFENDLM